MKEITDRISYNSETGEILWRASRYKSRIGKCATRRQSLGYLQVRLDGKFYYAHRLAWLIVHGEWPSEEIDHINGDRADNRICNLRQCTRSENLQNTPLSPRNTTGFRGVYFSRAKGRYCAQIQVRGKNIKLGYFSDPEKASEAYKAAKSKHHRFEGRP